MGYGLKASSCDPLNHVNDTCALSIINILVSKENGYLMFFLQANFSLA